MNKFGMPDSNMDIFSPDRLGGEVGKGSAAKYLLLDSCTNFPDRMRAVLVNGYHIMKDPSPDQRFSYFKHITAGSFRENKDSTDRAEVNEFFWHDLCQLLPISETARGFAEFIRLRSLAG